MCIGTGSWMVHSFDEWQRKRRSEWFCLRKSGTEDRSDFPPEFREDPWADEKFNVVGLLFQNFIYVAILLTGLAGGLAAKSYNDGATFFLQKATSDADSAQVISLEEVQRARNLPPAATSAPQVAAPE
ncbi:hypothetical protein HOP50_18g82660 [Chloropicon primus]|nr:hypothetical protein HOP50_18g82660 [Chloropicon primus]